MRTDQLPTPCLLLDRPRHEVNLVAMQARVAGWGIALRPHAKTHKSVAIARRQLELGARGITVATVSEAEVFVGAGVTDVRVAYAIAGKDKLERLASLARGATVSFCVDSALLAREASEVFATRGQRARVLVEVDTGQGRCGVPWDGAFGVALAREIGGLAGVRLVGILTHAGHAYAGPADAAETPRAAIARVAVEERDRLLAFASRLARESPLGSDFEISAGSTPTAMAFVPASDDGRSVTELRPGNYAFCDAEQVSLGSATYADCALTVLTTVGSRRTRGSSTRLYVDAGKKILTTDKGARTVGHGMIVSDAGTMAIHAGARVAALSEEHGWIDFDGACPYTVGDRIRIVPNHACVVANMADALHLVEGDEVVGRYEVDARGGAW